MGLLGRHSLHNNQIFHSHCKGSVNSVLFVVGHKQTESRSDPVPNIWIWLDGRRQLLSSTYVLFWQLMLTILFVFMFQAAKCMSCQQGFNFLNRRHHCRRCGKCFCGRCCSHEIALERMYFVDPVRQCYDCAVLSKKEVEFYEKTLKILTAGTIQNVSENDCETAAAKELGPFVSRLTKDHRYIEFDAEKNSKNGTPPPHRILLSKVTGAKMIAEPQSPTGSPGGQIATGIELKYKDEENAAVIFSITLRSVDQRASAPWLASVQKALKMLFESRAQKVQEWTQAEIPSWSLKCWRTTFTQSPLYHCHYLSLREHHYMLVLSFSLLITFFTMTYSKIALLPFFLYCRLFQSCSWFVEMCIMRVWTVE